MVRSSCISSCNDDIYIHNHSCCYILSSDFPGSSDAVLALAAFHLRAMIGTTPDEAEIIKAKSLLLKAAKMDVSKSDPFSLLGVWYELQNDTIRARGCYQKALSLDASHPVAGRGMQRLMSVDELQPLCRNAVNHNSPVNGWAWRILGEKQSQEERAAALVCFQQALRCRDIQVPKTAPLGAFYMISAPLGQTTYCEASQTWAELAACYRRLGKPSAALRAFEAAYSVSGGNLSPEAFCAWAQVDLDLGLYEAAAETCAKVLAMESSFHVQRMATYIEGEALLSLARGRILEGKFGSCLSLLTKGAARLKSQSTGKNKDSVKSRYCELKLLGDIFSCGHSLPPYVFAQLKTNEPQLENCEENFLRDVEYKLSFLIEGEQAYAAALTMVKVSGGQDNDAQCLVAAAATDLGTNLLFQANVVHLALGDGGGQCESTSSSLLTMESIRLRGLITRSVNAYLSAIDSSPCDGSAWCGLGCALITLDPVMSQHAFSRGIQLDPFLADSWTNLSLLYASHDKEKSSEVLDQITQVEDTPLTWIGRGFLMEETAMEWSDDEVVKEASFAKAADAFRSALQIQQHSAALLGLSLNCRRTDPRLKGTHNAQYSYFADAVTSFESRMSLVVHQNMTPGNIGAEYVTGLTQIEEGLNRQCNRDCPEGAIIVSEAINDLIASMRRQKNKDRFAKNKLISDSTQCKIGFSGSKLRSAEKIEMFPDDAIKSVVDHSLIATAGNGLNGVSKAADNELAEAQQQVFLNPESGEAWLIFASQLAQGVRSGSNDTNMLSSAKVAARRAYNLLHDKVIYATKLVPRRQQTQQDRSIECSETSVVLSLPAASLFSYCMVLVSLLEETDFSDNPHACDRAVVTVQESLLLDPLNSTATALLNNMCR